MKRRTFIKFTIFSTLIFNSNVVIARTFTKNNLEVLQEVFEIIFPKTSNMPSAKEFGALNYLVSNINHKTFDDENKSLIVDGLNDFTNSFPEFLNLNKAEKKELILDIAKNSTYAKNWLSKLSYYGVEAMFSDPIYGGNQNQIGWKSVNHFIGIPRPKTTYGQKI